MKKLSLLLVIVLLATSLLSVASAEWKPEAPITIMNYVKSGGGMDIATRKFSEIAAKYTDATLVVDNKTGSGGIIAADYVLGQPADGYTVFATTISYVDSVLSYNEDVTKYIWGFEWIDNIMADPYAIMVAKDSNVTLTDLAADKDGQIWCGPSSGGAKHIAGIQLWAPLGIENVTYVPFTSGPDALLAVIQGQGVATVGNPGDLLGRDLRPLLIATETKFAGYEDIPNSTDIGDPFVDQNPMWRGYAVKKGTPAEFITWWQDLCQKVTEDQEWIDFFNAKFVNVHNETTEDFTARIKGDIAAHLDVMLTCEMVDEAYIAEVLETCK